MLARSIGPVAADGDGRELRARYKTDAVERLQEVKGKS